MQCFLCLDCDRSWFIRGFSPNEEYYEIVSLKTKKQFHVELGLKIKHDEEII